jgi:hypothetical protein
MHARDSTGRERTLMSMFVASSLRNRSLVTLTRWLSNAFGLELFF